MKTTINMPQSDGLSLEDKIVQDIMADPNINPNLLQAAINTLSSRINAMQPAQEQQMSIPENLNSENDSDSISEWDDPMDLVFGIRRNITLQIPHGITRGPIIYENNRSNFNTDQ